MIDRTISPVINPIEEIKLPDYTTIELKNGVPVHIINSGTQDVISIEMIFSAGTWFQQKPLVARCVNELLKEGTIKYNSREINSAIDYHGAFLQTEVDRDYATITLYTLNKHLDELLPILKSLVTEPSFPEEEFQIYLAKAKQRFRINEQKTEIIARKKFNEILFGEKHPYGLSAGISDYDNVKQSDLVEFWNRFYTAKKCKMILSGKVGAEQVEAVKRYLDDDWNQETLNETVDSVKIDLHTSKQHFVPQETALQSAIRIGRLTFTKKHPDFVPFQVLNTILGGYFGSRLMSNIREEKGYTYGIGSFVLSLKRAGYFCISTEVKAEVTEDAVTEIYKEIESLRTQLIPEEELTLVKNFLLGELLKSVDGPFEIADRWKGIILDGLGSDYFKNIVESIKEIEPQQIKELAEKYLRKEDLIEVVVGKK